MVFEALRKEIRKRQHINQEWQYLETMINNKDIIERYLPEYIKKKYKLLKHFEFQIQLDLERNQNFQKLWKILKNIDGNFWIVGGYTRDFIAGFKPKDIDIVTNLNIEILEKNLPNTINIKKVGAHFGVLLIEIDNVFYEISTLRADKDNNGFVKGNIKTDFERRDFDVNSIYYNLRNKTLEDWLDKTGIENAYNRKFQFQGNPIKRIEEDPMRILRVFKLEKKGFKPSNKTKAIARRMFSYMLKNVNEQRLLAEFEKLIFS